jgi:N-acetyl-anhydromuramyl-L-alanine amidase AmpD
MGPLKLVNGVLCSWPKNYTQFYCKLDQTDRYVKATYRGFDYYAAYTPAQIKSTVQLVGWLCEQFDIPHVTPPEHMQAQQDLTYFATFKGIASHQNFRSDKFDVGPAFDWSIFDTATPVVEQHTELAQEIAADTQVVVEQQPTAVAPQTIKEITTWQTILKLVQKAFNRSNNQKDS